MTCNNGLINGEINKSNYPYYSPVSLKSCSTGTGNVSNMQIDSLIRYTSINLPNEAGGPLPYTWWESVMCESRHLESESQSESEFSLFSSESKSESESDKDDSDQ